MVVTEEYKKDGEESYKRHSIGGDTVIGSGLTHYHPFRGEQDGRGFSYKRMDDVEKVFLIRRFITRFFTECVSSFAPCRSHLVLSTWRAGFSPCRFIFPPVFTQ